MTTNYTNFYVLTQSATQGYEQNRDSLKEFYGCKVALSLEISQIGVVILHNKYEFGYENINIQKESDKFKNIYYIAHSGISKEYLNIIGQNLAKVSHNVHIFFYSHWNIEDHSTVHFYHVSEKVLINELKNKIDSFYQHNQGTLTMQVEYGELVFRKITDQKKPSSIPSMVLKGICLLACVFLLKKGYDKLFAK